MYLGWSTALTDAFKAVLTTLFNTFIDPLVGILVGLFDEIVLPILKAAFMASLYSILKLLLGIVEVLQTIFDLFSGVSTVKSGGKDMYILDIFLTNDTLRTAFIGITLCAAAVCMIFTIYSVGKSIGDNILENKHPVGEVLREALKSMISFLIIPFMIYLGSQLATTILVATDKAMNVGMGVDSSPTFASLIFLTGTFDMAGGGNASFTDAAHKYFLENPKAIYDITEIQKHFDMLDYNFILPYVIAIITAVIMACSIFVFIRRIFDILVLYVSSPFFVATRPLDNGQIFRKWQEMLIGKMISSFGIVFTMKLVMLIIPRIMCSDMRFVSNSFGDMIIKAIFLVGGVYAAYKSQALLIEIISPEAARAARESSMMLMAAGRKAAMVGATVATGGAAAAGGAAAGAGGAAAGAGGAAAGAGGAAAGAGGAAGGAGGSAAFTGGMGGSPGGLSGVGGGSSSGAPGGSTGGMGSSSGGPGSSSGGPGGSSGSQGGNGFSGGSGGNAGGGDFGGSSGSKGKSGGDNSRKAITDGSQSSSKGGSEKSAGDNNRKAITDGNSGGNNSSSQRDKSSAFDKALEIKDKLDSFNDGNNSDDEEEQ